MRYEDLPDEPESLDVRWVHVPGCSMSHTSHEGDCVLMEALSEDYHVRPRQVVEGTSMWLTPISESGEVSGRRMPLPDSVIAPTAGEVRVHWDALPDSEPINSFRIIPPPELSEEQARDLIARFEAVSRTGHTLTIPLSEGVWDEASRRYRAEDAAEDHAEALRQQEGNWQRAADAVRRHGYRAWNRDGVPMPTDQEGVSAGQSPHIRRAEGTLTPTDQEEYDLDPGTRRPVQPPVRRPASSAFDSRSPQEARDEASRRYLGTLRERALASLESDDEARATRMAARRERRSAEARARSERVQAGTEASSMYERNLERHRQRIAEVSATTMFERLQAARNEIASESSWDPDSPAGTRREPETSRHATSGAEAVRRASEASQAMSESVRRTSAAMTSMGDALGRSAADARRRSAWERANERARFPEPYSNIVDGFTTWCRRCATYKAKDQLSLCPVCSDDDARTAAERGAGFHVKGKEPSGGVGAV